MYEIDDRSGREYSSPRRYTLQPGRILSSSNEPVRRSVYSPSQPSAIDDPYVRELLEREIDFSAYDRGGGKVELLSTNPVPARQNYDTRRKPSAIIRDHVDPLPSRSVSQGKNQYATDRSNRKWIIEQPTNSGRLILHQNRSNGRRSFSSVEQQQQQPLVPQRIKSINYNRYESQPLNTNQPKKIDPDQTKKVGLWNLYDGKEKRNIFIYIIGIMLYKFGLEAFNGSIVSLATNRYDRDAFVRGTAARTFEKVGLMVGLNQACQCIGSILIAPLIKSYPTRTVLSVSIFVFSLLTALLMIVDAATGGKIKPSNYRPMYEHDYRYYGNYPTSVIIPIYCVSGIAYGMVELIRRIIPRDIVGSDEEKLQRMDAIVHVFYEIAGVSGALLTGLVLIPRLGNNYAFLITPVLFTLAAIVWFFINSLGSKSSYSVDEIPVAQGDTKTNYFKSILRGFYLFGKSVYLGGKIIFRNRKYIWLFPCYALTLYVHRYLENAIAPQIAKRYLQNSEWSQIIVGGSNFGELLGAISVFFTTKKIASPLVWLRLDCLLLLIAWYIPFYRPSSISIGSAWIIAASYIPFGFGGAGDDISLNAHIQSSLSAPELKDKDVSSLSAVMSFLYSTYIILYAILNPVLGRYIDQVYNAQQTIRPAMIYTVGVQITVISVIVFLSTFIPKSSFKLNPSLH